VQDDEDEEGGADEIVLNKVSMTKIIE